MFLSQLIGKTVFCSSEAKGIVLGVGVNAKNGFVKYLLCSNTKNHSSRQPQTDFAVAVNAILSVDEGVTLSKLRTLYPKNCSKLFLFRPVYTNEGIFCGTISDAHLDERFVVTKIILDDGKAHPFSCVSALSDALILRRKQLFPLGQRVPAPFIFQKSKKKASVVSRSFLKQAIDQGYLVSLTISLIESISPTVSKDERAHR